MKKLILIGLIAVTSAYADTVAMIKNNGGGLIVLTDVQSENCRSFAGAVYATTASSKTIWGCWLSDDLMVHVRWDDGDVRSYPISEFQVNVQNARRLKERNTRRGSDV